MANEPRIAVLVPVYNEDESLPEMLSSLSHQTIPPTTILVGDNESTDYSAQTAESALDKSGFRYRIETVRRIPEIGKLNINRIYWQLSRLIVSNQLSFDYLATIEADVVLEPRYFEKLVDSCETDSKLGITGGRLEPLGILDDPFPFWDGTASLWGSNRLYMASCWLEINGISDLRCLPAWDTDHVLLARLRGYHAYPVDCALSRHLRDLRPIRGLSKGLVDRRHGLPIWWAAFKTIQNRDFKYLQGYLRALRADKRAKCQDEYYGTIRRLYRYGAAQVAAAELLGLFGLKIRR